MMKSVTSSTATSDYPTPTVSTMIASYPTCSHKVITSDVFKAIPPKNPAVGEGLIYEFGYQLSSSILVLSPRIDPPVH